MRSIFALIPFHPSIFCISAVKKRMDLGFCHDTIVWIHLLESGDPKTDRFLKWELDGNDGNQGSGNDRYLYDGIIY